MKKRVYGRRLSRGRGARKALFRSLIAALVAHGRIKTTKAKAKAIQGQVDKIINIAKNGSLASKRRVLSILGNDRKTSQNISTLVVKAFADRNSGYTRIVPLPKRLGDGADMVRMEWVKEIGSSEQSKSKKESAKKEKEKIEKPEKSKKSSSKVSKEK